MIKCSLAEIFLITKYFEEVNTLENFLNSFAYSLYSALLSHFVTRVNQCMSEGVIVEWDSSIPL